MQKTARSFRGLLHRTLCVFVHVHAHEVPSVLYSFFALFSLLGSYFLLLPLREDAGISLGTSSLPALCACTLAVTLLFIPAASAFLSRSHPNSREVALQQFYYFMAGVLLVFYFLYSYAAIDSVLAGALPHQLQQNLQHWQQQQQQQQHSKPQLLPVEPVGLTQQHLQQQQQHWSRQVLAHGPSFQHVPLVHSTAAAAAVPVHAVYHVLRLHISDSPPGQDPAQQYHAGTNSHQPHHAQRGSNNGSRSSSRSSGSSSSSLLSRCSRRSRSSSSGCPPAAAAAAAAAAAGPAAGTLRHLLQQVQQAHEAAPQSQGTDAGSNRSASSSNTSSSSSSSRRRSVSSRHGDPLLSQPQRLLRGAFYVWVNVMNLVCISSLWARCADAFTPEAGARLFGFISAGATLGQLMGSLMAMLVAWAAELVAERASSSSSGSGAAGAGDASAVAPASGLILGSAVLQLLAAQLVCRVRPLAGGVHSFTATSAAGVAAGTHGHAAAAAGSAAAAQECCFLTTASSREAAQLKRRASDAEKGSVTFKLAASAAVAAAAATEPAAAAAQGKLAAAPCGSSSSSRSLPEQLGLRLRNVLLGFQMILRSRYLLMLCGNLLLTYVVGSLMYFQRALVVSTSVRGPSQRTAFFAALNTWSAACILLMQLFATSSLLRYLGMQAALGLGPLICLAGICSISSAPSPAMVAVFEVVRKVFAYAVYRPSREVLFTVVSRDEKYSAKLVIDTVVQRLGDALAAAAFQVLDVQWSLGQAGVGAAGVAMCFVWLATAHKLGQHHKQLAKADAAVREKMTL